MKDLSMFVWITQLGLSVAAPLAGFTLLGLWLRDSLHWGSWVVAAGITIGLISAVSGFRSALAMLERREKQHDDPKPPVSYNQHE